jgi:3-deoxy-D-manno-octulosonic-acid transferase
MYTIFLLLAVTVARIVSPFSSKIKLWLSDRSGGITALKRSRRNDKSPLVWMHCASLGEFEQGKPVLEAFLREHPGYKSLVTFFSPSGLLPSRRYRADIITYLPLDTWFNARQFVDAANPSIVFWIKYDYWMNHLRRIKQRGVPCYLVSARFRPGQVFFGRIPLLRGALRCFEHLFVQTEQSKQLLAGIGIENVTVTGDTRFDRVNELAAREDDCAVVRRFVASSDKVLIAGSSWAKDEAVIAEALRDLKDIKLILVPHETNAERIEDSERTFGFRTTLRYSRAGDGADIEAADVLIVDVIGILSTIYRYAGAAFIGCGFDHGIHNTLEAAVYGIPVSFGPKHDKFEEAKELVALGGAVPVNNAAELRELLSRWFEDSGNDSGQNSGQNSRQNSGQNSGEERRRRGRICADYVRNKSGTSRKILDYLTNTENKPATDN